MAQGMPSTGQARGWAFGPESARRRAAELRWAGAEVMLVEAGAPTGAAALCPAEITRIETLPGSPARIDFASGWIFETEDPLEGLPHRPRDGWLTRLEAWHPRLLAFALLGLLAGFALWRWGLDVLASAAVVLTPPAVVSSIDSFQMQVLDRGGMAEETRLSAARQAEIRTIFNRVAAHAPTPPFGPYRLEFRVLEGMGPNAFALPDGTVVLSDELATRFADENILAGVIGHEMAHTAQSHGLHQLYRAGASYLLIALIVGDAGPILEDLILEGNALLSLRYSRAHEAEADAIGQRIAADAGYDPAALAGFLEALEKEFGPGGPEWLSTHPNAKGRAKALRGE